MSSDVLHDTMDISWHKKPRRDSHPQPHDGSHTIAISAFFLSTLEIPWQRKRLVKEMWESGAGTIVSRLIPFDILPLIPVRRFYWITAVQPASKTLPRLESSCWTLAGRKWRMARTRLLGHTFWHRYVPLSPQIRL